jgi:hypothetical protein
LGPVDRIEVTGPTIAEILLPAMTVVRGVDPMARVWRAAETSRQAR